MEAIIGKMKEYLAMDSEIEVSEFQEYYNTLMAKLRDDYQELGEEDLLKIRYILNTVSINAENRGARKDKNKKKFKKIAEKTKFWADAITLKLKKEMGYTTEKLEEADEGIDVELRPQG